MRRPLRANKCFSKIASEELLDRARGRPRARGTPSFSNYLVRGRAEIVEKLGPRWPPEANPPSLFKYKVWP